MSPLLSKKEDEKDGLAARTQAVPESRPPPAYAAVAPQNGGESSANPSPPPQDEVDITAAFSNLFLDANPKDPDVDTCLAHLKLLYAMQTLKEDTGYTDGLWGIWDSRAPELDYFQDENEANLSTYPQPGSGSHQQGRKLTPEEHKLLLCLSKIREKRWALFVARAVDRYEAWWASLPQRLLDEREMVEDSPGLYHEFVNESKLFPWSHDTLPPLDVLMVLHAHMLNPRAFLEDCMRCGLSTLWASGMPWLFVSAAIDTNFAYEVSDQAKANWVAQTGRDWDNAEDSPGFKLLKCPACRASLQIPWTTCGRDEKARDAAPATTDLVGSGYGDGDFTFACTKCKIPITKKLLSVAKFITDARLLTVNHVALPGTILDPISGKPEAITKVMEPIYPRTFPNRLVSRKILAQVSDLIQPGAATTTTPPPDMDTIRAAIEKVTSDGIAIRDIEGHPLVGRARLNPKARIAVRKMMARYWDNASAAVFGLDLAGAVLRQSIFTHKMFQIDWLHSPACRETMVRLIRKYARFVAIMAENPTRTCVPTLDVDLAWHTHQLAPKAYYKYTTLKTFKFIDHDDKIEQDKLSTAFEWTMKAYQDKYREVYSECTCWYCESIRTAAPNPISRLLGLSTQQKAASDFHSSGRASLCEPSKSAHISAHNAVMLQTSATSTTNSYRIQRQQRHLEAAYAKACKRAQKQGRPMPARDSKSDHYDHWGYSYYMYSPFFYPLYFSPGIYYGAGGGGCAPGVVASGWAACAAGSCGGGVAAGACGGAGGCGGAVAGGCGGGAGAGGCGGGGLGAGGGCGGGGGGCGGGGGGGGGGCGGGGC